MHLLLKPNPLHDLATTFNYVEVGIWTACGIACAVFGMRRAGAVRRDCLIAAVTYALFGVSDYAEARTGNRWWDPWWLFVWKAACVAVLGVLLVVAIRRHLRGKRAKAAAALGEGEPPGEPRSAAFLDPLDKPRNAARAEPRPPD